MRRNYTYRDACCNDGGLKTFELLGRNYHAFKMQANLHEPVNPSTMCAPVSCIVRCGGWLDDKKLFQIVWREMQNRMLELLLLVGDCLHLQLCTGIGCICCVVRFFIISWCWQLHRHRRCCNIWQLLFVCFFLWCFSFPTLNRSNAQIVAINFCRKMPHNRLTPSINEVL